MFSLFLIFIKKILLSDNSENERYLYIGLKEESNHFLYTCVNNFYKTEIQKKMQIFFNKYSNNNFEDLIPIIKNGNELSFIRKHIDEFFYNNFFNMPIDTVKTINFRNKKILLNLAIYILSKNDENLTMFALFTKSLYAIKEFIDNELCVLEIELDFNKKANHFIKSMFSKDKNTTHTMDAKYEKYLVEKIEQNLLIEYISLGEKYDNKNLLHDINKIINYNLKKFPAGKIYIMVDINLSIIFIDFFVSFTNNSVKIDFFHEKSYVKIENIIKSIINLVEHLIHSKKSQRNVFPNVEFISSIYNINYIEIFLTFLPQFVTRDQKILIKFVVNLVLTIELINTKKLELFIKYFPRRNFTKL